MMWTRRKNEATANRCDVDLSLLGKNARFKGTIMFEGTARIDGRLEGDISTDGILVIGEEAVVEGNIVARTVICAGSITGDIVASERVELVAPAVLTGHVKTPRLSLQEGVSFLGTSEVQSSGLATSAQPEIATESATTTQGGTQVARKKLIPWGAPDNSTPASTPAPVTGKIAIGE
jgi:cytoskeletal protein CcmA (bactofilin family)